MYYSIEVLLRLIILAKDSNNFLCKWNIPETPKTIYDRLPQITSLPLRCLGIMFPHSFTTYLLLVLK
jgi:hypothetical protein